MAAAPRENEIGRCRCPVCDSTKARLRFSAKGLAYVNCDACNIQLFARSDNSDRLLRALHIPEAAPTPPVDPAPADPPPQKAPAKKPAFGFGAFA